MKPAIPQLNIPVRKQSSNNYPAFVESVSRPDGVPGSTLYHISSCSMVLSTIHPFFPLVRSLHCLLTVRFCCQKKLKPFWMFSVPFVLTLLSYLPPCCCCHCCCCCVSVQIASPSLRLHLLVWVCVLLFYIWQHV